MAAGYSSPVPDFIALAADKQATAEHLAAAGVPVPHGIRWDPTTPLPRDFPYPAVVKPVDGAGSLGLQRIAAAGAAVDRHELTRGARLERFCPGTPASIAVLCGPARFTPLPACRQWLSNDGRFQYLGGITPLPEPLAQRARELGTAAVAALPPTVGYVGIDLVLARRKTAATTW